MIAQRHRPLLVMLALGCVCCTSVDVLGRRSAPVSEEPAAAPPLNVLEERQDVPISQVNARLNDAFLQLFFGDPSTEAVYFDQGDGTAFIEDIANGDVRTDSMAYGMLVAVQLNQRDVFDKLWAWTKNHMRSSSGPTAGLLRWRCDTTGTDCATNASTDASSIIATALLIADSRFGQVGVHDYNSEALELLEVLVAIEERNGGVVDGVVNCFDGVAALPRAESTNPESLVPVDYLMPAFYEIWAERDVAHGSFWRKVATNSRALLVAASHKTTGLLPEKLNYDGTPVAGFENYRPTTARTHLNLFLDHTWYGPSSWIVQQNSLRLRFFLSQGVDEYVTEYTPSGAPLSNYNTAAHRSLVALAAGTTSNPDYDVFLERLLAEPIPSGTFRYYDGMLYMLSLLALSGQMTSD